MTETEYTARLFETVHKLNYTEEPVDVRFDPTDEQITTEIIVNDIPFASLSIAPTEFRIDGERIVAHPDFEGPEELLQEEWKYDNVVVAHFDGELITEMGEVRVELHLETTEDTTVY